MYHILRKTIKDKRLKVTNKVVSGVWIYAENPTDEEFTSLRGKFKLDESLLRDAIDPFEVPRMEEEDGILYIFTRVPQMENGEITTFPMVLAVAKEFIATVASKHLPFFEKFEEGKVAVYTTQKTNLLIQIFSQINVLYTQILIDINREIRKISSQPEKIRNRNIFQFARYEETINKFLGDLIPTSVTLKNIISGRHLTLYERDKDIIEDLLLSTEQLIETSKSNLRTIVNLRDAYQTVATHNLNRIIQTLTVVTVILTIPTFIAGLWGMNVQLPFANSPNAFWDIIGIIVFLCSLVLFFFIKKGWF